MTTKEKGKNDILKHGVSCYTDKDGRLPLCVMDAPTVFGKTWRVLVWGRGRTVTAYYRVKSTACFLAWMKASGYCSLRAIPPHIGLLAEDIQNARARLDFD